MLRLDPVQANNVEHQIAPPMRLAITLPTSVPGVAIYIVAASFGEGAGVRESTLKKIATEIVAIVNGAEARRA